jgi:hypothetical protein
VTGIVLGSLFGLGACLALIFAAIVAWKRKTAATEDVEPPLTAVLSSAPLNRTEIDEPGGYTSGLGDLN